MTEGLSPPRRAARPFAAVVALSAWFGLAVQFGATASHVPVPAAAWILARYFTIWVGLAVALGFTGLALRRGPASPALIGGLTLNGLLVAVVYHLLLAGTLVQTGPERLADLFLHGVTPALVLAYWVLRVPRGALRYADVAPWAAAPLLYLAVALARGAADGIYPYPFLDVAAFGRAAVARNAAGIAAGFLASGAALVWFDRRLGGRAG